MIRKNLQKIITKPIGRVNFLLGVISINGILLMLACLIVKPYPGSLVLVKGMFQSNYPVIYFISIVVFLILSYKRFLDMTSKKYALILSLIFSFIWIIIFLFSRVEISESNLISTTLRFVSLVFYVSLIFKPGKAKEAELTK